MIRTAMLLALAGCAADAVPLAPDEVETDGGTYLVHLHADPQPFTAATEASLGLHVTHGGDAVVGAVVDVKPFMPDMGHGLMGDLTLTEGEMGTYTATFTFPMAGYWTIDLSVDSEHGADSTTVAYEVE